MISSCCLEEKYYAMDNSQNYLLNMRVNSTIVFKKIENIWNHYYHGLTMVKQIFNFLENINENRKNDRWAEFIQKV